MDMTSYFRSVCLDFFYEIRQSDGEYHVDYGELVEIETGNRIPIWRTFVFRKRKQLYLSRQLIFQNKMRFANIFQHGGHPSWGHVGDMMQCNHPTFIQIGPSIGEL